jgi:hypothetical protein
MGSFNESSQKTVKVKGIEGILLTWFGFSRFNPTLVHRLLFLIPILLLGCKGKQTEQPTQDESDSLVEASVSQSPERDFLVDASQNIWQRRDRFQLKLPKGYYLRNATIYSEDSLKFGEIALDNQELISLKTNKELFLAIQNYSIIKTTETNYGYSFPIKPEEVEKRFVLDSTATHPIKWYYSISEMEWESIDDWGTWNVFSFKTIQKEKITSISFYNKDMKDLSIDKYLPILNSVRFIEQ